MIGPWLFNFLGAHRRYSGRVHPFVHLPANFPLTE